MTDYHPLTEKVLDLVDNDSRSVHADELDRIVRAHLTPKDPEGYLVSGVKFADSPDIDVEVSGTFIESGNQVQMALIGTEPVILVQPEYDADRKVVTLVLTTVDLAPSGLVTTLETLLDATREIVEQQQAEEVPPHEPIDCNWGCLEHAAEHDELPLDEHVRNGL